MDQIARLLEERGHLCSAVAGLRRRRDRWRSRLSPRAGRADALNGYPTVRTAAERVPELVADELRARRADVVVCWSPAASPLADAAVAGGARAVVWVPDVSAETLAGLPRGGPGVLVAGCSQFVAERLRERHGVPARVLRPAIRFADYRAADWRPEHVTLVNPRRFKGLEVVLAVAARLRHRRFVLVDSWQVSRRERLELRVRLVRHPNVRLQCRVPDLRSIYARTALLLVPSQCEDASPRVILEAQVNGIPVVASRRGGIPEVLADGGVLLAHDAAADRWVDAVEGILADRGRAAALSLLALANVARPELAPASIVDALLAMVRA